MKRIIVLIVIVVLAMALLGYCGASRTPAQIVPQNHDRVLNADRTRYVLKGDGFTDDTDALNAWGRGEQVMYQGRILGDTLQNGTFLITWRINFNRKNSTVRFNTFVRQYAGFDSLDILHFGRRVRNYNNNVIDESPFREREKRRKRMWKALSGIPIGWLVAPHIR